MAEGSNVVGLKYVAEGLDSVLAGLRQYQTALKGVGGSSTAGTGTARAMDATTAATKRADTEMQKWFRTQRYLVTLMNNSEQAAERKARALEQAAAREARAAEMAASKATIAQNRRDAEERRALQNYLRYQREKEQAALREARVAEQAAAQAARAAAQRQREEAQAAAQAAAVQQKVVTTYDNLLDTLNPLAAAQQRYNQQVAAIQAYHQQASSSAEALKADLDALNAAYARAGSPINQFGQVTGVAGTRANTLGLVLQQTGYQVGDFAVQVQSGTNAFVAFGQQATQLAGLLYLIPGAIGVIAGTIASIGIPIVTAILGAMDRWRQSNDEAAKSIKGLDQDLKALDESLAKWLQTREAARRGLTVDELLGTQGLDKANADLAEAEAKLKAINAQIEAATAMGAGQALQGLALGQVLGFLPNEADVEAARAAVQKALETVENIRARLDEEQQKRFDEAYRSELQRLRLVEAEIKFGRESLRFREEERAVELEAYQARLAAQVEAKELTHDQARAIEEVFIVAQQLTAEEEKRVDAQRRLADAYQQYANSRSEGEAMLRATEEERGRNALQAALEWFDAQVAGQQAAYEAAEETRKAAEEGRQLAVELADSYASALGIANSNMAGAVNNAAAAAAILAQRLGVSMQTARAMSGLATMTPEQRRVAIGVRTGVIPPVALQSMGITPEQMSSLGLRGSEAGQPGAPTIFPGDPGPNTPLFRPPSTGAGSSGSGRAAVDEQAEAFERLRRSIDDTYRAQQMFTEGKAILDAQFADKNSAEYLRLLDLLKQKYPEVAGAANDFGNQLNSISRTIATAMEDAFMSIIDGSKSASDAFKGMARIIIAEVVKLAVVRPLVGAILGAIGITPPTGYASGGIFSGGRALPFANGGAFYGGNVMPFANGGVVSSPTLFPMRNGTGLMGEAGPEAIMPLKRTSSGKLGVVAEGGSGTVNQTLVFNIAANGDESVRRIVRDESPWIAEQAKAAVLDARRRGGAYGKAF